MNEPTSAAEVTARAVSLAIHDLVAALPQIEEAAQSGKVDVEVVAGAVVDLAAGVMDAHVAFGDARISTSLFGLASATYRLGTALAPAGDATTQNRLQEAAEQLQDAQLSFDLDYLQLQSQQQSQNRSYTAVSNILKTKHDTVKNAISNIH